MMIKAMSKKVKAKIRKILQNKVKKKKINHQKSRKKLKGRIEKKRKNLLARSPSQRCRIVFRVRRIK